MTPPTREEVYTALFALVEKLRAPGAVPATAGVPDKPGTPTAAQPFNTVSREVIEVQNVDPGLQPVLFMDEAFEENLFQGTQLVSRVWTVYFHIGCTSTKSVPAAKVLNPLIDAVERALASTVPDEEQQLGFGDRITGVRLDGTAMKNQGNNSTAEKRQAVYYLPVKIVIPV